MPRVLIIDDDPDLLTVCTVGLEALGHQVSVAGNGRDGLNEAAITTPEVIVLDLGLPDLDGLEVCKRIRIWSDVPIVVLSADSTEDRKVEALDAGADDYVTKPFGMRELSARLRVALRHRKNGEEQPAEIDAGRLHFDLAHHEVTLDGREIDLTPKEFEFLAYLARHAGKICTRRMILENVWGPSYVRELHYLKVYAYRIRRKLDDERGEILQSDPSVGYRLSTSRNLALCRRPELSDNRSLGWARWSIRRAGSGSGTSSGRRSPANREDRGHPGWPAKRRRVSASRQARGNPIAPGPLSRLVFLGFTGNQRTG